ncbi:uncharacterized protein LOC114308815 isoform X2 [Camellia sinensis]|uniref:XS domain-containing protein n=1 Tax=Camellia sinensis var. sinensis TaxID=542762 RepID=A0A4S4DKT0_CAMSN|nr:uncharacterized protein LOC114308815 isoform X2 [Camellia sinensis]THG03513.1 hypothetical protein TEA_013723 [Camellia sinensis var. sinensis]
MMREKRLGGDVRLRSPPRVTLQGGRDYSLPRGRSRDHRTGSPIRSSVQGRDYSWRERHSHFVPGLNEREKSRRVLGSEHPSGSSQRRDYSKHLDGDGDGELQKLSQFNEALSQRDSPSLKFQWKYLLDEHKRVNDNVNHSSKNFPDCGVGIISSTRVNTERNYQGIGFADTARSGMMVAKPIHMEIGRDRTFPGYLPPSGTWRSSVDTDSGGLLLPSQKLNSTLDKDEDMRFQAHLPADKLPARELLKEEDISKFYSREEKTHCHSRDTSHYAIPSSQSKTSTTVPFGSSMNDYHYSGGNGYPIRLDGFSRSSGLLNDPISHEAYTHDSHSNSSRDPTLHLEDMTNYMKVQLSPKEGTQRGYAYSEVQRSEKSDMGSLTDKLYGKMVSIEDDYGHRESLGPRIVEPIIDRIVVTESSGRERLIEGRLRDYHRSSQEQPISNYPDAARSSYASKKEGEDLGPRSVHLEYERELYRGHENIYSSEDHGYGIDDHLHSDEERLNMSLMEDYDLWLDGVDDNHQDRFIVEELGSLEHPKRMLKRKWDVDKKLIRQNPGSKFSSNRKITGKIHDTKSNKPLLSSSRYRNVGKTFNGMVGHRNCNSNASGSLSACNPRRLKYSFRDIKKRLGPVPQHVHIPQPSAKKIRLQKSLRNNQDGYHGSIHAEEGGPSEVKLTPAKSEPPENSKEFKQLVHSAFFKFVKQLNENPAQRRRLKEQGKIGSLKCSVCGSDSKVFLDTKSLVMHACTAPKVGFRARHLGFHKAVCSLMGWKSAEILNSQWVHQVLPNAETVAVKEDFIIWPPVVVIHNSSVGNINPDGRVIVSIEELEAILKDMGFGGKTKVCRGKPANQSIMVVKFSGTFSGLQEAERLHKFFSGNERGRTELKQVTPKNNSNADDKTQKANKVERVLYGYLGIAEDLDKLDFETKKWCSVRSKKEI